MKRFLFLGSLCTTKKRLCGFTVVLGHHPLEREFGRARVPPLSSHLPSPPTL